ncbi:MAG TPA: alpha-amylase/4-alpha-glucanotransferase domain-containing protein [Candidatus Binatia bacterium]|nr:alpha-amylase/4-alpha-glucanotransferase domain-containing protein [Candidatus Binatia bacterium]
MRPWAGSTSRPARTRRWANGALPADEGRAFADALRQARESGSRTARWLRGAFWRNFQVKYREVNDLHKQMLRVSDKVEAMPPGPARDAALDHLYRGQSNDCYWHGLFGGIYLPHIRAATLSHLIAAEDIAEEVAGAHASAEVLDVDLDGRDELRLATAGQVVTVDLDEGAGIGSWDLRAARHALTSVLRRRPEAYHETLRRHEGKVATAATTNGTGAESDAAGAAPASIHEMVRVKEAGLADRLIHDDYERRSGLIRVLPLDATAEAWGAGGRGDLGDFVSAPFAVDRLDDTGAQLSRTGAVTVDGMTVPVRAQSELRLAGDRLDPTLEQRVSLENLGAAPLEARIGIEYAITMLGGGGNPEAWWDIGGARTAHDATSSARGVERVAQGNGWLGVELESTVSPAADAWVAPIETVSNSESGFERVYQGSALLLSWPVRIAPGERWSAAIRHAVTVSEDRAGSGAATRAVAGG